MLHLVQVVQVVLVIERRGSLGQAVPDPTALEGCFGSSCGPRRASESTQCRGEAEAPRSVQASARSSVQLHFCQQETSLSSFLQNSGSPSDSSDW